MSEAEIRTQRAEGGKHSAVVGLDYRAIAALVQRCQKRGWVNPPLAPPRRGTAQRIGCNVRLIRDYLFTQRAGHRFTAKDVGMEKNVFNNTIGWFLERELVERIAEGTPHHPAEYRKLGAGALPLEGQP